MIHPDLEGCNDCPAAVSSEVCRSTITGGPVLVVSVTHEPSCPTWRVKLAPHPERRASAPAPDRLLLHSAAGDA